MIVIGFKALLISIMWIFSSFVYMETGNKPVNFKNLSIVLGPSVVSIVFLILVW